MQRYIIWGPPGTGKTHTLLERLEGELKRGVPPQRIAFLTFTRRARHEAVTRVEQVLGLKVKDLPYFRTIHSMSFRAMRLQDGDVMGRRQLNEFGQTMGLSFGEVAASEQAAEGLGSQSKGDHMLAIDNLARLRGCTVHKVWQDAKSPYEWPTVDQFTRSYARYKKDKGLLDFTDVLTEYAKNGAELPVDTAFIDEAQDLSALQWLAALKAVAQAQVQYIAADDDQAIFRWAGAEVEVIQTLPGEQQVLHQSYRLPRAVHAHAMKILERIKKRVPKEFRPRDAEGHVYRHANAGSLVVKPGQTWLWLVRNRYLMAPLQAQLVNQGIVYSMHGASSIVDSEREAIYAWERLRAGKAVGTPHVRDLYSKLRSKTQIKHGFKLLPGADDEDLLTLAELKEKHGLLVDGPWFDVLTTIPIERRAYYRKLLRTHNTLKLSVQVVLETIHGAKGAQSDHVALFLEMSKRTWDEMQRGSDDEERVWFVGATRARTELHVVGGSSRYLYPFPRVAQAATAAA